MATSNEESVPTPSVVETVMSMEGAVATQEHDQDTSNISMPFPSDVEQQHEDLSASSTILLSTGDSAPAVHHHQTQSQANNNNSNNNNNNNTASRAHVSEELAKELEYLRKILPFSVWGKRYHRDPWMQGIVHKLCVNHDKICLQDIEWPRGAPRESWCSRQTKLDVVVSRGGSAFRVLHYCPRSSPCERYIVPLSTYWTEEVRLGRARLPEEHLPRAVDDLQSQQPIVVPVSRSASGGGTSLEILQVSGRKRKKVQQQHESSSTPNVIVVDLAEDQPPTTPSDSIASSSTAPSSSSSSSSSSKRQMVASDGPRSRDIAVLIDPGPQSVPQHVRPSFIFSDCDTQASLVSFRQSLQAAGFDDHQQYAFLKCAGSSGSPGDQWLSLLPALESQFTVQSITIKPEKRCNYTSVWMVRV